MGEEATRLREEIDRTREELTRDVNRLTDKTSPSRIVERRMERTRDRLVGWKEKVMGSSETPRHAATSSTTYSTGASPTAYAAGNPLAAGLVAFGVGWLVSSLVPASDLETQTAQRVGEATREHGGPVLEQAQQSAAAVAQDLKDHTQAAAEQLKETAQQAAAAVRDTAQEHAAEVKDTATEHARATREEIRSSSR